jgi:hypothetical protein
MPALHDLQSDFRRFLTGGTPQRLVGMVDGDGFDPEARLSIYRNNTISTLSAALEATFPVVCRLVDDRFFNYAACTFIRENLPTSPCLVEYGSDFPRFLAGFAPAADLGYLPDVARLEWAINRVLHAPNSEAPIPIASLLAAQGDPAQIGLFMEPAVKYVASLYPIDQIWRSNQPGDEPAEMALDRHAAHLEIRRTKELRIVRLPPAVWAFRSAIAEGATLGAAATEALAIAADFDLAPALAALFDAGLVVGFQWPPTEFL